MKDKVFHLRLLETIPGISTAHQWLHSAVLNTPAVYFPYRKAAGTRPELAVDEHTDIVIEGFTGSANTFAEMAFRSVQPGPVRIAHHLHAPAQIFRAAQLGIPTIVLVRKPADAAGSDISRHPDSYSDALLTRVLRNRLKRYINFYTAVLPYHEHYVVGSFEGVTSDFASIIRELNTRFGTDFVEFENTEENVARVQQEQRLSKPGTRRGNSTQTLREIVKSDALAPYLAKAEALHSAMLNL